MSALDVVEHLRSRERAAFEAWLASPPEHTTMLALAWHAALRALDAEIAARCRVVLRRAGLRP